jgi:hypothetical protein
VRKEDSNTREGLDTVILPPNRAAFVVLLSVIALLSVGLAIYTWGKWGDPLIDVGVEFEVAWKILEGRVLYRDVAFNHGPFSPHFNSALLWLFGIHVGSFVFGGFISAGLGSALVYFICRRFLGPCGSVAMISVFLLENVFQHYYLNGCFNFILPYSFSAVHGILFALGAILILFRHLESRSVTALAFTGVFAGFSLLCKIEIGASILLTLTGLSLFFGRQIWPGKHRVLLFSSCWAIPLVIVTSSGYLPFIWASSFEKVVCENVLKPTLVDFRSNVFFLKALGVDNILESASQIAISMVFWSLGCLAAWMISKTLHTESLLPPRKYLIGALGVFIVVLLSSWFTISYITLYRYLPVMCLSVVAMTSRHAFGSPTRIDGNTVGTWAFGLFAFLCMGRILLNVGTFQYGFFMALPALILSGVFLSYLVPTWLGLLGTRRRVYTFIILLFIVFQSVRNFVVYSSPMFRSKSVEIRGVNGQMMAHPMYVYGAIQVAMEYLADFSSPEQTLLVIPEGVAINFLAGIRNPTSYSLFMPPELNAPGVEDKLMNMGQEAWASTMGRS